MKCTNWCHISLSGSKWLRLSCREWSSPHRAWPGWAGFRQHRWSSAPDFPLLFMRLAARWELALWSALIPDSGKPLDQKLTWNRETFYRGRILQKPPRCQLAGSSWNATELKMTLENLQALPVMKLSPSNHPRAFTQKSFSLLLNS